MGAGGSLRELAAFLDACEEESRVSGVELGAVDAAPDGLTADVELVLSAAPGGAAFDASIDDDGVLRVAFETAGAVVPTTGHDVAVEPSTVAIEDGTVTVTLSVTVPNREGDAGDAGDAEEGAGDERGTVEAGDIASGSVEAGSVTATTVSDGAGTDAGGGGGVTAATADGGDGGVAAAGGGTARPSGDAPSTGTDDDAPARERSASDVPPFEDRELLQEVYERHDTFAEMPEALGMDVTAETVRRYMIDFGIHEPRTYDTSSEAGDGGTDDREATVDDVADDPEPAAEGSEEAPVVLADGVGLPDDVTVDAIVETVRESNTIYEVTRDIGVDREAALELLRELDLLEFVVGRLATEAERSIERETVVERLRKHADAQ